MQKKLLFSLVLFLNTNCADIAKRLTKHDKMREEILGFTDIGNIKREVDPRYTEYTYKKNQFLLTARRNFNNNVINCTIHDKKNDIFYSISEKYFETIEICFNLLSRNAVLVDREKFQEYLKELDNLLSNIK